ncbi:hypothetical protein HPB52_022778 [Rhipicephalus sanguineus]|uniref:Uncharacterized protein n=1 Tax=Rhipicephalus sanguineus TaxID=34632 RepID=A0A9D4T2V4_RHISA|nr:hypothetical protein HPB52_022778 [Rhipicephalus sanguineus]
MQADVVISAEEKGAGDAKTEKYPQKRNLAEVTEGDMKYLRDILEDLEWFGTRRCLEDLDAGAALPGLLCLFVSSLGARALQSISESTCHRFVVRELIMPNIALKLAVEYLFAVHYCLNI